MPFTLSHAGFLMPLQRRLPPQIMLAAGIGSIMPDFGYCIRRFDLAWTAHSAWGGLLVSLPLGLVVYGVYFTLWQDIAALLPQPHRLFWRSLPRQVGNPVGIAIALLLGAYSHNIVDSCTHASGWMVMHFPWLQQPIGWLAGEAVAPYRFLQNGGSLVGMIMLLVFYGLQVRKFSLAKGLKFWQEGDRWLLGISFLVVTGMISAVFHLRILLDYPSVLGVRMLVFRMLITWMPLGFGVIVALALGRRILRT
ncbi:MAG: DUF4184 family protein [Cyanobacteria bacterium P01_G01_bin.54]